MKMSKINSNSLLDIISDNVEKGELSPYLLFKYSIKTELTRKYYERRLRRFFNFIDFDSENNDIETRCNKFAEKAKRNNNWILSHIIRFIQYQKNELKEEKLLLLL